MSPSPLDELCDLVAELVVGQAAKVARQLEQLLNPLVSLDAESRNTILLGFIFTGWTFANGVWSNLKNTNLRRDLMSTSKTAVVLKTATRLSLSQDPRDIAFFAANNIEPQFRAYFRDYLEQLKKSGMSADSNSASLFGLEWIQSNLNVEDSVMNRIVPLFVARAEVQVFAESVQSVAAQTNRAASERKRRGFLARFFGS